MIPETTTQRKTQTDESPVNQQNHRLLKALKAAGYIVIITTYRGCLIRRIVRLQS